MLYVFFGTDVVGVREAAHVFLSTYEEKGIETIAVTPENYHEDILVDLAGAASLFPEKQVMLIDTLSEKKELFEDLMEHLELLSTSDNAFVLIEGELSALQKKKVEKYAIKSREITAKKEERYNIFKLTDAFLRRDKKSLWLLLVEAWRNGLSNEEILGTLFWQLKILRLAQVTKSAAEAGQKPFVYEKAKRALAKFKENELDLLSKQLLSIYHEGHLGKRDIDIALERWVLAL